MAKLKEEDLVLNIIVNGNKAQSEVGKLGRSIQDTKSKLSAAESEMKKLEKAGKTNSSRYRQLDKDVKTYNTTLTESRNRLDQLNQSMKLEDQTIKQLSTSLRKLRSLRDQSVPGTSQYKEYENQIAAVNKRLVELRHGAQQTGNSLINMSGGLNRYISTAVAGVATITAAVSGINRAKNDFAEFDDIMSDVQKTTNATKEEVIELDKALHQLDTRTSDEDLLGLGRIAGKLGYTDLQEIQEFIGATNQIVVALNQDLGGNVEETVNKIGKLVDIFQLRDLYDTEEAFLKVGSAINELGMASTANEGYMVEFARRMAGIAPLAGISIEEILGLGATLDQLGQTAEVSSTSLSKLFLGIAKDAETYAKYAGMQVTEFKELLEKDFMQAFTKVLRGVQGSSEGINQLAATLGDLGQDGGRVIGVIGSLANNVDVLQQQIDLSNKAMQEGTSITNEYNIKNSNAAAQLDKARNEVGRLWRELGRNLWPTITSGNNLMIVFIKAIISVIDFISKYRAIITTLISAYVSYNAVLLLNTTLSKQSIVVKKLQVFWNTAVNGSIRLLSVGYHLLNGNIIAARMSMIGFNAIVRANPIAALVAVVVAATTAFYMFTKRVSEAEYIQRRLNDVKATAEQWSFKEISSINRLSDRIKNQNISLEDRLKSVNQLREIMPAVLKDYTDEEILAGKATSAIKEMTQAILLRAEARALDSEIDNELSVKRGFEKQIMSGYDSLTLGKKSGYTLRGMLKGMSPMELYLQEQEDGLKKSNNALDVLIKERERIENRVIDLVKVEDVKIEGNGNGGGGNGNDNKDAERQKLALEREKQYWDDLAATQEEGYNRELHALDKRYAELLKMQGLSEADRTRISEIYTNQRNQILLDIEQKNNKEYRDTLKREWEQTYKEALADQEQYYLDRLNQINDGQTSEYEKELEMIQLEEEHRLHRQELEVERLNTRLLNLQAIIEIGDLEIEEERRVADEIAAIKKQLVDNAISEAKREQSQRLAIEKETNDALEAIKMETVKAYEAAFSFMGDVFKNNTEAANVFLVLEKAAAAAYVITNLQKEIAGYYAAAALQSALNPFATALATKKATAAKIRAGISLATIAGTTISGIASNSKQSQNKVSGRESGGYFDITRAQDGRRFRSRIRPNQRGYVDQPTVLVGENGTEWVASAQALSNPDVSRIISILDTAQRQGQISTIGLSDILTQSGLVNNRIAGRANGGSFSDQTVINNTTDFASIEAVLSQNSEIIDRLNDILEAGIISEVVLTGRNGLNAKQAELDNIQKRANL